jgi:hypothetical protein
MTTFYLDWEGGNDANAGANGGNYGAGGGGSDSMTLISGGSSGQPGLLVLTYTPTNFFLMF